MRNSQGFYFCANYHCKNATNIIKPRSKRLRVLCASCRTSMTAGFDYRCYECGGIIPKSNSRRKTYCESCILSHKRANWDKQNELRRKKLTCLWCHSPLQKFKAKYCSRKHMWDHYCFRAYMKRKGLNELPSL